MHASILSTLYNAHFDTGGTPWTPDDLMGRGDRGKRQKQRLADRMEVARLNRMGATDDDADLPDFYLELKRNREAERKPN